MYSITFNWAWKHQSSKAYCTARSSCMRNVPARLKKPDCQCIVERRPLLLIASLNHSNELATVPVGNVQLERSEWQPKARTGTAGMTTAEIQQQRNETALVGLCVVGCGLRLLG